MELSRRDRLLNLQEFFCHINCIYVDTPFCNPHLILHRGYKSNFTFEISISIVATRSLILFHQSDIDIVTIKLTNYKL